MRVVRPYRLHLWMVLVLGLAASGCGGEDNTAGPDIPAPPPVVDDLRVVGVAAGEVTIEWSEIEGVSRSDGYGLYISTEGPLGEDHEVQDPEVVPSFWNQSETFRYRFQGLENATMYHMAVRAKTDASAWSDFSNPARGTTPELLLDIDERVVEAVVSPSGVHLAFVIRREIWINVVGAARVWRIADGERPCWSPDGQLVAFVSRSSSSGSVYAVPAAGGMPGFMHRADGGGAAPPSWAPSGDLMAISVGFDLEIVSLPGGVSKTFEGSCNSDRWSWSPDSRQLVAACSNNEGSLIVFDRSEGSFSTRDLPLSARLSSPAWSPTGEWIAFLNTSSDTKGLWAVHTGTGELHRITTAGHRPSWFPDGSRIAFVQDDDIWSVGFSPEEAQ